MVERLLDLGAHLPPQDRALLEAVYHRGMTAAALARAIRARPRSVQNRIHRLVRRVTSPLYVHVASQQVRGPRLRREIGELIVLRGVSQRRAAAKLGVSLHRVRQEIAHLRALTERREGGAW